jgi:hypothetical protein
MVQGIRYWLQVVGLTEEPRNASAIQTITPTSESFSRTTDTSKNLAPYTFSSTSWHLTNPKPQLGITFLMSSISLNSPEMISWSRCKSTFG